MPRFFKRIGVFHKKYCDRSKKMITETIKIGNNATLKTYIWDKSQELKVARRPAMLVIPGGAYVMCSDREGEPVALSYMAEGYNAFVLRYTTNRTFEAPFAEACEALDIIRNNAEKWSIDPEKVSVVGFSAGGHLACSLGVMAKNRPNAMILGYPAVIGKDWEKLSDCIPDLVSKVSPETCPAYVISCVDDPLVPINNAIKLIDALNQNGVPFESHIYNKGGHGFSLANGVSSSNESAMCLPRIEGWIKSSVKWLESEIGGLEYMTKEDMPEYYDPELSYKTLNEANAMPEVKEILGRYCPAYVDDVVLGIAGAAPLSATLVAIGTSSGLNKEALFAMVKELKELDNK